MTIIKSFEELFKDTNVKITDKTNKTLVLAIVPIDTYLCLKFTRSMMKLASDFYHYLCLNTASKQKIELFALVLELLSIDYSKAKEIN